MQVFARVSEFVQVHAVRAHAGTGIPTCVLLSGVNLQDHHGTLRAMSRSIKSRCRSTSTSTSTCCIATLTPHQDQTVALRLCLFKCECVCGGHLLLCLFKGVCRLCPEIGTDIHGPAGGWVTGLSACTAHKRPRRHSRHRSPPKVCGSTSTALRFTSFTELSTAN